MTADDSPAALHACGAPPAAHPMLPSRGGIGLKSQHFQDLLNTRPDIGFVEIHAENYMGDGGPFHHYLQRIREHYPLSLHGVGLSIGGDAALDEEHLQRLARLIERYAPATFSEHLAWSSHDGVFFNDLLPVVYDRPRLRQVCAHIDELQHRLQRQLLLENPASYVEYAASTLDEAEFIAEVVRATGCGLLLDVNNLYVSCVNHQRDAQAYLQALPLHATAEIHLAGHACDRDAAGAALLIDDHGSAVADAVWALYADALSRTGPQPTLIERDNNVPALAELVHEAQRADRHLRGQA